MRAINRSKKLETIRTVGRISCMDIAQAGAGDQNVTNSIQEAYPKITLTYLRQWNPKVVFNGGSDRKIFSG
jgi:ABC-type Fe3+-hydroxamate transport system substrate-binding protein